MTNLTYFHSVVRDAYTDSSSSQGDLTPQTSQRQTGVEEENLRAEESDSSSFSISKPFKVKTFTLEELTAATTYSRPSKFQKLFTSDETRIRYYSPICLTRDESDRVFRGYLHRKTLLPIKLGSWMDVAVDVILLAQGDQLEDPSGWVAEVKSLQKLAHPNLEKLLGYCLYDKHRLLVYERMPRNLTDYLCNHMNFSGLKPQIIAKQGDLSKLDAGYFFHILPWGIRMKVALGAAKGLAFLHRSQMIYRNFKAARVHLDTDYNVKLCHYGLTKNHLTGDKSHVAPECPTTGHLTVKSDVYNFGVLLLEILSGRQHSESELHSEESNLVKWAMPYLDCNILHVLDRNLKNQYPLESIKKVADLVVQCLVWEAELRPNMDVVVQKLERLQDSRYMKITELEHVRVSISSPFSQDSDTESLLGRAEISRKQKKCKCFPSFTFSLAW